MWYSSWGVFNPDPQKQAVGLNFSKRKSKTNHPIIFFNASPVSAVDQHRHLGILLDSKLSFSAHIQAAVNKSIKAIRMLKFMSRYLPRNTLNELYKLCVQPHPDYGHVIYHIPQGMGWMVLKIT